MKEKNYTGLIPVNTSGKSINAEKYITVENTEAARLLFMSAKKALLNVNEWHSLAGLISAKFQIVDAMGINANRDVIKGDYFKIDIPGPGSKSGDGYDWVYVEDINEINKNNIESIGFRVRPCANPLNNTNNVAHFYSNTSTSTFIITRENNMVIAGIYDRNTKPNAKANSLIDQVRDTVIGINALTSFSKIQWKNLVKAFLNQ